MKKYLNPIIEVKSFKAENIVTESAGQVDSWNEDNGYNAKTVNWKTDLTNVTITF